VSDTEAVTHTSPRTHTMAVIPRQKSVSEAATANSLQNGGMSQQTRLFIALGIVAALVTILGVFLWFCCRRCKRQQTTAKQVIVGFNVLRVRKFVPDEESEDGPWRVLFSETESHSNGSITTTHVGDTEDTEDHDDTLALSRFSDKEVVPSIAFASLTSAESVPDPSSQESETERISLVSRIKTIFKGGSVLTDIESRHIGGPRAWSSFGTLVGTGSTAKENCTSNKKEHDVTDDILGIDKTKLLQRLTDNHGEILPIDL